MSRAGRMYKPVSYSEYNVVCFLMVSDCETTSTYNELKYLLLKRSLTKLGHSYKQQLTFPLTFFLFLKICHVTYKSRTENKTKTKNKKMCNQWQTLPSEVVL